MRYTCVENIREGCRLCLIRMLLSIPLWLIMSPRITKIRIQTVANFTRRKTQPPAARNHPCPLCLNFVAVIVTARLLYSKLPQICNTLCAHTLIVESNGEFTLPFVAETKTIVVPVPPPSWKFKCQWNRQSSQFTTVMVPLTSDEAEFIEYRWSCWP